MLKVNVEDLGEVVILRCWGRITRGDETAILCEAVRRHGRSILLDMENVDAIDAAGIGALISLQAAGIYLRIVGSATVREVLKVTGLESVFEICELETADQVLGASRSEPQSAHTRFVRAQGQHQSEPGDNQGILHQIL